MDKKGRIMAAAEGLFRSRQLDEITLDEVATRADVGKGTIYLYFADKEDLFFQTAVAGFDDMCELLRQAPLDGVPFREGLLQACDRIGAFFEKRRPLFRMILAQGERALSHGGGLRQRWLQRRGRLTEAVATVIARGIAAGDVRADIPADVLAEYLLALLRARVYEMSDKPDAARSRAALVDLFVNGAHGARAPRPAGRNGAKRHHRTGTTGLCA